jgi:hypothetical protein
MPANPEITWWLEWAGGKLMAHPMRGLRPATYRSYWPDYKTEINEPERKAVVRPPNAQEINVMDEILLLPNLCVEVRTRRVVHLRSMINPLTGRNIVGWTRLAEMLHSDRRQIRRVWERGIDEIDDQMTDCKRSRFLDFCGRPPSSS